MKIDRASILAATPTELHRILVQLTGEHLPKAVVRDYGVCVEESDRWADKQRCLWTDDGPYQTAPYFRCVLFDNDSNAVGVGRDFTRAPARCRAWALAMLAEKGD